MLVDIIPEQKFESIRDAIGRVLTAELANQKALVGSTWEDINIFLERTCPLDKEELPAINIAYAESQNQDENTAFTSIFDNKYLIEVYVNSESSASISGDHKAALQLGKIMGIIRAILMNNKNYYLDFTTKFIQTRRIQSIVRTQPRISNDAENTQSGTLEAHYIALETTELETGVLETLLSTVVKINETEKGYKFIMQNL